MSSGPDLRAYPVRFMDWLTGPETSQAPNCSSAYPPKSDIIFHFILCLTIWGVEPGLTHHDLIRHPGLKAQKNVVCHKTKLVSILLHEEPN